jgi:hypothetical protein
MAQKTSAQPVGNNRAILSAVPVLVGAAYSAGDAVGGKLTFSEAVAKGQFSGVIDSLVLIDLAKQAIETDLYLFDRDFTATNDNAAFDPTDADLANCIGVITLVAGDYKACSDNHVACKSNVNLPFALAADGSTLYGQLVTRGTPTYVAAGDLTVKLGVQQD